MFDGLSGRKASKDSGKGLCVAGDLAEVAVVEKSKDHPGVDIRAGPVGSNGGELLVAVVVIVPLGKASMPLGGVSGVESQISGGGSNRGLVPGG